MYMSTLIHTYTYTPVCTHTFLVPVVIKFRGRDECTLWRPMNLAKTRQERSINLLPSFLAPIDNWRDQGQPKMKLSVCAVRWALVGPGG